MTSSKKKKEKRKIYKSRHIRKIFITLVIAMEPVPPFKPCGRGRGIPAYQPREYRRPTPDWVREMEERDELSSEDDGNYAEDWSDEEPTQPPLPPKPPTPSPLPPTPPTQPLTQPPLPIPPPNSPPAKPPTPEDTEMAIDDQPPTPPLPVSPSTPDDVQIVAVVPSKMQAAETPQQPSLLFCVPTAPPPTRQPPSSFWKPTMTLKMPPENTLRGQREVIRQQNEEIRQARSELADLRSQVEAATRSQQELSKEIAATERTLACFEVLRRRRKMSDAKLRKEHAAEKEFREAVIKLQATLRRDDDL